MESWTIFLVWLLISCLVNIAESFTDTLKHYALQTNALICNSAVIYSVLYSAIL